MVLPFGQLTEKRQLRLEIHITVNNCASSKAFKVSQFPLVGNAKGSLGEEEKQETEDLLWDLASHSQDTHTPIVEMIKNAFSRL